MIGRVFNNRYQITERIGIGGMAEVYRAQDNVLGRLVAVKVMLPQYAADPSFTQRFKQEAAAAANLQSPYIVNVYDWGHDEGTYYIVMEFVRGSDLKTAINERGAINQRKVAEIGSQVCQALSVAHGLDIIHRDIKPQNIMVQPDGNVKVMDFGIARAKNSVKTQTSSVLGTAHYISPEQAQGKDLTATSDIYSLGIVLYESATGRLPFDGPDAVSVAMKQVNDLPAPPHEINPDIDPALEAIIMKAMAKNPADRFATSKDMRLALNDYLAGRPVNLGEGFTSAQTSVMGGVVPPIGPAAVDGTAVMPAMGGVGGVNPAAPVSPARSYRSDDGNGKKSNKKTIAIVIGIIAALAIVGGVAFALMSGGGSNDKDAIPLPDVVGQSADQATATLTQAGFTNIVTEESFNEKVEAGKVVSQDPRGGTKQKKDTKITLGISKGTQEITVPDLTGKTADQAKKELTANGLKYSAGTAEYSDKVEKDHIVRQDVAPGTQVAKGTTITYYLSLGSEGIEVPNVVGMMRGDAVATLNNLGLLVDTNNYTYQASDKPEGTVLAQTPAAGSKLQENGMVALTLSKGPDKKSYSVAINSNGGGSVTSDVTSVEEGGQVTIKITPDAGYEVASVRGIDDVPASGGTFTLTNVKGNVNVTVTFQKATSPAPSGNATS
ncbi:Stk1 family PASTA domain-containing Ser/Thr kinase [Paraeggerthella hongkongensis]|uniref:Stk1 family PASTA domain-containing Ser/Thr kinase n=1 Tax=Paraeggerthella TaxID=651554 RepID=UPI000DF79B3A|nr:MULTISPECIES: Stk1 family PASTA domain-containing Ser/Thr kinase [Paraeggerthella]MBU5405589.1 Stk1 family PASTA domain-containing Ser/Thr kinase [Paraeggerthella hongkongensis]MCD2432592.1 Stk1 family PASTA domain-containing Ser/Thr kinase [Paraeggerthella hominis]MDY3981271.1 Stk1 family PASTA domain-containing Ser/Thr kinase [Paraeggerthella sp.]RDB54567.1 serine/threonine protein kinase [Paraeggerthella hongkongensis]